MNWQDFYSKARPDACPPEKLLALDPGETTGWALFTNGDLDRTGQLEQSSPRSLYELIHAHMPQQIVCEEYRVYQSKAKIHIHSDLPIARLIGSIELSADLCSAPITFQKASDAKHFCSTPKLKDWGLYQKAHRHAVDATRHGCFYLLFSK